MKIYSRWLALSGVLLFVLIVTALQLSPVAHAQTDAGRHLWVDRDSIGGPCSDEYSREEVNKMRPWCTLGVSGDKVQPGDLVHVREGTYTEPSRCDNCDLESVLQVINSGRTDAWIRYIAEPGEKVRITGAGGAEYGIVVRQTWDGRFTPKFVSVEGFEVSDFAINCVTVRRTSDVTVRSMNIYNCRSGALEILESARALVEYNKVHDNALAGYTSAIDFWRCGADNVARGNLVWNNVDTDSRETEGHGIMMDLCDDNGSLLVENNVVWNNEGWCISLFGSNNAIVRNNTCWHNGVKREETGEIAVLGHNHAIHNNILAPQQDRLALYLRERSPDYMGHLHTLEEGGNLLWSPNQEPLVGWSNGVMRSLSEYKAQNGYGWGVNTIEADPLFVDAAAADFRLQANSPAIDSADDENAPTMDLLGAVRPADGDRNGSARADRGAYEYGSLAPVAPAQPAITGTPIAPTDTPSAAKPTPQPTSTAEAPPAAPTATPPAPTVAPTQEPTVPPAATATSTPSAETTVSPAPIILCSGDLRQEAEEAKRFGLFELMQDAKASGGIFIGSPANAPNAASPVANHRLEFCLTVQQAGTYAVEGAFLAPNESSDSFYIQLNNQPGAAQQWNISPASDVNGPVTDEPGSEGSRSRRRPYLDSVAPGIFQLAPGQHILTLYHRESGTGVDWIELTLAQEKAPLLLDPTEIRTQIFLPLIQQAE